MGSFTSIVVRGGEEDRSHRWHRDRHDELLLQQWGSQVRFNNGQFCLHQQISMSSTLLYLYKIRNLREYGDGYGCDGI